MLKALLKKQLLESMTFLFKNSKSAKHRSAGRAALYAVLMLYILGIMGYMFFNVASALCDPLASLDLDWLYFAIMSAYAAVFSVFFSVFSAQSQLYDARDNELLLSMPIPPGLLLLSRMISLYIQTFLFQALALVPAMIVYYPVGGLSIPGILLLFILPAGALAVSCVLGGAVAFIVSKLKNKSLFSVVLSLLFLAVYFWVYSQMNRFLMLIVANGQALGMSIKSIFPLYHTGLAFLGEIPSFLIVLGLTAAAFGAVYALLSVSFIKIITSKKAGRKRRYVRRELAAGSVSSALLRKEFMRFRSSSVYMMNCGLGSVFMAIAAVYIFIKGGALRDIIYSAYPGVESLVPLIGCAAICLIITMNDITAPSVSLEGKTLWLSKSMPVDAGCLLTAKLKLHLFVTLPFVLLLSLSVVTALRPGVIDAVMIFLIPIIFTVFAALFGLVLGIKFPNFTWSNETVAVKQSVSAVIAIFGGWGVIIALALLCWLLYNTINIGVVMIFACLLLALACALLWLWIMKKGTRIFESY